MVVKKNLIIVHDVHFNQTSFHQNNRDVGLESESRPIFSASPGLLGKLSGTQIFRAFPWTFLLSLCVLVLSECPSGPCAWAPDTEGGPHHEAGHWWAKATPGLGTGSGSVAVSVQDHILSACNRKLENVGR